MFCDSGTTCSLLNPLREVTGTLTITKPSTSSLVSIANMSLMSLHVMPVDFSDSSVLRMALDVGPSFIVATQRMPIEYPFLFRMLIDVS